MKTVVINLIGGPGCGKSTVAADVFCKLKKLNKNVKLIKFLTTNSSKNEIIEQLSAAIEKREIGLIEDNKLFLQLSTYEMTYNPKTMKTSYNAPLGLHDDAVMSLAICFNSILTKKGNYCIS